MSDLRRWVMWMSLVVAVVALGCQDPDVQTTELNADQQEDAGWLEDAELECSVPLEDCDGNCVDVTVDVSHCGECGNECADGEVCSDGSCTTSCPAGQQECDQACFDLEISPQHCGECGNDCAVGEVCSQGACEGVCAGGLEDCDGACRDLQVDRNNCGECGNACVDGEVCSQGECQTSCGGGLEQCDGICRDLQTDRNNCGECGNACADGQVCSQGECQTSCGGGLEQCDGICRDLQTDRNNCGECGNACADGQVCSQGECQTSCGGGLQQCDGVCRDLQVDRNNCGECGVECADGEVCEAGECELSCEDELTECDGACRNLDIDPEHCGSCGNQCGDDQQCLNGTCSNIPILGSCAEIKAVVPQADDGYYTIDTGVDELVMVYCDMTTDGGVGHTIKRIEDDTLGDDQNDYRQACEDRGLEVVVPRTQAHAGALTDYNDGEYPNLVNVFPEQDQAEGLDNWEGRCQGEPCSFFISETNNANCPDDLFTPDGSNTTDQALHRWGDDEGCGFGQWNDDGNTVEHQGWVMCAANDTERRTRHSCRDYYERDEVYNVGSRGINGMYTIQIDGQEFDAFCDMTVGDPVPQANAPVGYWDFNGDYQDSSGYGNHGTEVGDVDFEGGLFDQAASFPGSDDNHVALPNEDFAPDRFFEDISTSKWVHWNGGSSTQGFWGASGELGEGGQKHWEIRDGGALRLRLNNYRSSTSPDTSTDVMEPNQWVHVAFTYDADTSTGRYYVDGQQVFEHTESSGELSVYREGHTIGDSHDGSRPFDGRIDEFRMFDEVLAPAEVERLAEDEDPLVYDSCQEVEALQTDPEDGDYLIDEGDGPEEVECVF